MQAFLKKHKYIILIAGACIQIFTGIPASWGVFQRSVCSDFNLQSSKAALIFSFTICAFGIGSVIGGFLQDKKGPRVAGILGSILLSGGFLLSSIISANTAHLLYFSFSLPVGLGTAFLYPAVMSCAQKWYSHKKGFATGVIGVAVGLSGAVLTLFVNVFSGIGGIRLTFFALGIITAIICSLSCIVLENPDEATNAKYKNEHKKKRTNDSALLKHNSLNKLSKKQGEKTDENYKPFHIMKTSQYWVITLSIFFAAPAMILFSPIIIDIAISRGLNESIALFCVAIASVFSAMGRLIMPWLSDKIGRKKTFLILFFLLSLGSIAFIFVQNIFVLALYCLLAFSYSGQAAVIPCSVTDIFGEKNAGINYGLTAIGMSMGSLFFPLLANNFETEIARHIIAVISSCIGLILMLLLKTKK